MRDEQHRLFGLRPNPAEFPLQHRARHGIQRAKGFIHQQHARIIRERARNLNALLHAAGKLRRVLRPLPSQADHAEEMLGLLPPFCPAKATQAQPEANVIQGGQPFIKAVMALKDHAAISARALYRRAIQKDAASRGGFKPGHHVQDRGFAAA